MSKEKINSISRRLFNQLMGLLNLTEDIWLLGTVPQKEILSKLNEYYTDVIMITSSFVMYGVISTSAQNRIIGDTMLVIQNSSLLVSKETFTELRAVLIELKASMDEQLGEV